MSADYYEITVKVAIPPDGEPTVYSCKRVQQDSAGPVVRGLSGIEKRAIRTALITFLEYLTE